MVALHFDIISVSFGILIACLNERKEGYHNIMHRFSFHDENECLICFLSIKIEACSYVPILVAMYS